MVARSKQGLRLLLVVAVLGVSIWYLLQNVQWEELWDAILKLEVLWLMMSIATTVLSHLIRAERWRLLIPSGKNVPLMNAFSATMIGYFMNNLIPRSGEIIRPYVLARRQDRPFSSLVATVIVERILDGLTLVLLFVLLVFIARDELASLLPGYSAAEVLTAVSIPILALAILLVLALYTTLGERLLDLVDGRLPDKWVDRFRSLLRNFRAGISFGGSAGAVRITLWTVAIWLAYASSMYFGFLAFGFDARYGLDFADAVPLLAVTAVGITIAPTPGAIGVYHSVCKAALVGLFGVEVNPAIAFALVAHAVAYLTVMPFGAGFMLRENLSFKDVTSTRDVVS